MGGCPLHYSDGAATAPVPWFGDLGIGDSGLVNFCIGLVNMNEFTDWLPGDGLSLSELALIYMNFRYGMAQSHVYDSPRQTIQTYTLKKDDISYFCDPPSTLGLVVCCV